MSLIHKWRFQLGSELTSYCDVIICDMYSLSEKRQMATYWENVTCNQCLIHHPENKKK